LELAGALIVCGRAVVAAEEADGVGAAVAFMLGVMSGEGDVVGVGCAVAFVWIGSSGFVMPPLS
jgi:hypothetical protein